MYKRISDLRKENSLTQKAIAEALHISQATYSRYEQGVLNVPVILLIALAQFYKTSVDYIVDFTDEKTPHDRNKSHQFPVKCK